MVQKSSAGLTYVAEYRYGSLEHKMGHLVKPQSILSLELKRVM
jgi:hypothetical protein